MKLFTEKEKCYGCGACYNICPKAAIELVADEQGFLYPIIDNQKCVECCMCKKVCQIDRELVSQEKKGTICYGIKNSDQVRNASSSGGIYTAFSNEILKHKGLCAGAVFDPKMNVIHTLADNITKRNEFRGSKYIQSDMGFIYKSIERELKKGKEILFTGTPCQVSGLKTYLYSKKVDIQNLYLIDLVCHGVPSPGIWKAYIDFLEKKYNSKVIKYTFRDKDRGWHGYHIKVTFSNNKEIKEDKEVESFVTLFQRDIMLRPSCYRCPYASLQRTGDLTIGDFWGLEKSDLEFSDDKGVSMLIVNTNKGKKLFEKICATNDLKIRQYNITQLKQPNLYIHTEKGDFYNNFWSNYIKFGYERVAQKYGGCGKYQLFYRIRDSIIYRLNRRKGSEVDYE